MLLHAMADIAANVHELDPEMTVRALQDRETLGPTGVGHGVALPHARVAELDDVKAAFIRLEKAIRF